MFRSIFYVGFLYELVVVLALTWFPHQPLKGFKIVTEQHGTMHHFFPSFYHHL
jgi:hypothetical protein